jgi:hypothetical protein
MARQTLKRAAEKNMKCQYRSGLRLSGYQRCGQTRLLQDPRNKISAGIQAPHNLVRGTTRRARRQFEGSARHPQSCNAEIEFCQQFRFPLLNVLLVDASQRLLDGRP